LFEKQKRKREEKYITKWRPQAPGEAAKREDGGPEVRVLNSAGFRENFKIREQEEEEENSIGLIKFGSQNLILKLN
jgi:hypothetical protein